MGGCNRGYTDLEERISAKHDVSFSIDSISVDRDDDGFVFFVVVEKDRRMETDDVPGPI